MDENTRRGGFPLSHFVRKYTHNSINKDRTRTFYLLNDCSNIGHIHSLGYSYRQYMISEL